MKENKTQRIHQLLDVNLKKMTLQSYSLIHNRTFPSFNSFLMQYNIPFELTARKVFYFLSYILLKMNSLKKKGQM